MSDFPWHGVSIAVLTALTILGLAFVLIRLAWAVITARDELRDRYLGGRWKPATIDILALPCWLAIELLCLIVGIAFALLTVFIVYQTAKEFRDWWHNGDRRRGR
jgi:multisubunit Na+/H+ antiporter MnhB subunit